MARGRDVIKDEGNASGHLAKANNIFLSFALSPPQTELSFSPKQPSRKAEVQSGSAPRHWLIQRQKSMDNWPWGCPHRSSRLRGSKGHVFTCCPGETPIVYLTFYGPFPLHHCRKGSPSGQRSCKSHVCVFLRLSRCTPVGVTCTLSCPPGSREGPENYGYAPAHH